MDAYEEQLVGKLEADIKKFSETGTLPKDYDVVNGGPTYHEWLAGSHTENFQPVVANPDVLADTSEEYNETREELGQLVPLIYKSLSDREMEVLRYLEAGYSQTEAAKKMGITQVAVFNYRKRIQEKVADLVYKRGVSDQ